MRHLLTSLFTVFFFFVRLVIMGAMMVAQRLSPSAATPVTTANLA